MWSLPPQFTPGMRNTLCDGQWHSLRAVKDKHKLSLTVDGISAQDVEGNEKVRIIVDITSPVFFFIGP